MEREQRGAATGSNLFMRYVGQTVGTAILGGIFNAGLGRTHALSPEGIAHAVHDVFLVTAGLALAMFALTLNLPAHLRPGSTCSLDRRARNRVFRALQLRTAGRLPRSVGETACNFFADKAPLHEPYGPPYSREIPLTACKSMCILTIYETCSI